MNHYQRFRQYSLKHKALLLSKPQPNLNQKLTLTVVGFDFKPLQPHHTTHRGLFPRSGEATRQYEYKLTLSFQSIYSRLSVTTTLLVNLRQLGRPSYTPI